MWLTTDSIDVLQYIKKDFRPYPRKRIGGGGGGGGKVVGNGGGDQWIQTIGKEREQIHAEIKIY